MKQRVGIIGHPVAHSVSPAFQGAAFDALGLDVTYELWDTPAAALAERLQGLREPACLGANVTIPHKEAVIPFLDELGDEGAQLGAVNTVVNRAGRLVGFNTDAPGFLFALREEAGFDAAGADVLILGAGGAARGLAFALAGAGAARVAIWNRTPARAARLVESLVSRGASAALAQTPGPAGYRLVVNCTSVGMAGGSAPSALPGPVAGADPGTLFVDIVYVPEWTPWLLAARDAGYPTLGGLPMLVRQGALSFGLWTGRSAPVAVMAAAARSALAQRTHD